jgi:hypothetical protein
MDPRERELHLRLDTFDLDGPHAGGLPRGVPQQRGLADARLPADHENGAVTGTRMGEHGVEAFALTRPANETKPADGRHLATTLRAAAEASADDLPVHPESRRLAMDDHCSHMAWEREPAIDSTRRLCPDRERAR